MFHFTAAVTCFAIAFYFFTSTEVARARAAFGIKAPATTGHPDFERVFRVQMNTLEWMPIFLPSLWLLAVYVGDIYAAALGAIWIVGRIMYWNGYKQAANKRSMGFAVQPLPASRCAGHPRRDRVEDRPYVGERTWFHSPRIILRPITRLGSQCRCSIMIDRIDADGSASNLARCSLL
jgi:glutathione S-transferase